MLVKRRKHMRWGWNLQSGPTDASRSEISARVGFCPHALNKSPRLVLATRPFPFVSNNANASRYCSVDAGFARSQQKVIWIFRNMVGAGTERVRPGVITMIKSEICAGPEGRGCLWNCDVEREGKSVGDGGLWTTRHAPQCKHRSPDTNYYIYRNLNMRLFTF